MNITWPIIAAVAVNLTFSTLGDICAKYWGMTNNQMWFYIGLPINIITIIAFMFIVKLGGLAIPTTIVLILTMVINVTFGYLMFKEQIHIGQWVGIVLGLSAILLILEVVKFKS